MAAPDSVTPRTRATAHLSVGGLGDDLAAASLRRSAESLLACGVAELTVDLSSLDDAYPTFVHTVATLTATARDRSCELFLIGVQGPAVLMALENAPLDELFAIYEAACRHGTVVQAGEPTQATGAPRQARTEVRASPTPTNEGALMVSIHTTETTQKVDRDRLVDLHVLSAHGDAAATTQAEQWMAEDPDARRMWDSVARTCEQLHASSA